ncbi:NAD(P)-dependent oxidoreductase [Shimia sp. Alg240-R146]|uniref:NAD(P)-dependent oxidoreductase n=1 Tax=Shimia sp. Alg240-R146 TaxID=2993449 RepID=UPI0022E22395|nr:NAD(P)-dependent oxidoreductase [Shimia sp. Alg240-R146]
MSQPKTALLGVGLMGRPMALNLMRGDVPLTVWNRSADKCVGLENQGITVANSAPEAVADAGVVISMVADGAITQTLVNACRAALRTDAVWIDMSSTKPADARAVAEDLAAQGVGFVDAPVSGGTKGAEQATLAIMAGGTPETFARVAPVLGLMGRPVRVGPVGAGQLAKLANQAIVATTIGAVAEAMLLLEEGGADPAAVRDALKGGFADSTILQQHGARMTNRDFDPGGLSRLQVKDLNNALEEAASVSLHLPMTEQVRARFQRYVDDLDGGERDHSGLYEELRDLNGISS